MSQSPGKSPPPAAAGLAKVVARRGAASRRTAEEMIAAGRVSVNGRVIESPALNVRPKDRIEVDGKPLPEPAPARLWLYHKPVGLVTTEKDEKGRTTVFGSLPAELGRVMSVGRLDINSEGLLLLTNDGALKRRLELPATGWLRKYRVRVNGAPDDAALAPLRQGIVVEGERFQPMEVTLDRQQGANAWLTVGLREGRNREVRRAMEAVGLTVNRLIRVSYGPFRLGELAPGAVEEVRPKVVRDQLGLGGGASGADGQPARQKRSGRPPHGGATAGPERTGGGQRAAGGAKGQGGSGKGWGGSIRFGGAGGGKGTSRDARGGKRDAARAEVAGGSRAGGMAGGASGSRGASGRAGPGPSGRAKGPGGKGVERRANPGKPLGGDAPTAGGNRFGGKAGAGAGKGQGVAERGARKGGGPGAGGGRTDDAGPQTGRGPRKPGPGSGPRLGPKPGQSGKGPSRGPRKG